MKATAGRRQPVGRALQATAGPPQPVEQGHVPFASSVVLSLVLHGILILWMLGSAWLLSRAQPYRLTPQTVYLVGDSPIALDHLGEGGGASGAKQESKEPGGGAKAAQVGAGAEPSVEKFAPPVDKPVPPPPKPVMEKAVFAPPPKPVVEKAAPPPPKPVVEKPAPPTPASKPVVEKVVPAPPKPPPETMTLAQKEKDKETKPSASKAPPTPTPPVAQQKVTKPQKPQDDEEETAEAVRQRVARLREGTAQKEAAQQRVASIRSDLDEQQAAQQRVAALRAQVGSGGTGEGTGSSGGSGSSGRGPGSGTAGTGSGAPGGGRGTGTGGAGGVGTGGLSGIRLRTYQAELQAKITNAWNIPPQSKGLQASVFLIISRAGQVEQARLVQGSGNMLFDESLQRAIKQAQPLPPLPEDYTERSLEVTLRFRPTSR